jgi:membrane associated rhomboid family serine protease
MSPRPTSSQPPRMGAIPRPGKALISVMVGLLAIWIMFAIGINWAGGGRSAFEWLAGNTTLVLRGQVWRLFTAPFVHLAWGDGALGHIITTLIGLYFLTPSLERKWGGRRMLLFLYGSAIAGFIFQMGADVTLQLLPVAIGSRVAQPYWFGAVGAVEAVAIAWALSFRGQNVALMFVLPVSSMVLVFFVVGLSVLRLLVAGNAPEGLFSPFGAMLFGWLLGGGDPPPLRRWWLQRRLKNLAEHKRTRASTRRTSSPKLRVIEGSRSAKDDAPSPDKRWLN